MAAQWVKWLELHCEKILLGVAGGCTAASLWLNLIAAPHTVDLNGQRVAPSDLHEKIAEAGQRLDAACRNAKAEDKPDERFSAKLAAEHSGGLFAAGPLAGKQRLRNASSFGNPVHVPGLEERDDIGTTVALVTPIAPSQPKLREGRSMAIRSRPTIGDPERKPSVAAAEAEQPVEVNWVTVGAYFDKNGQRAAMLSARYKSYLSNVYFAGAEVQRKERLASGEWSDWQTIQTQAMPELDIPAPVLNEAGAVTNTDALNRAFTTVKNEQTALVQPPFYRVTAGDSWGMPPLAGHEPKEEEPTAEVKPPKPAQPEARQPAGPRTTTPPPAGRGISVTGGGRRAGGGGGIGERGPVAPNPEAARSEGRRMATEDLKAAREAMTKKDYATARDRAAAVQGNEYATDPEKKQAEKIAADAEAKLAEGSEIGALAGGGRMIGERGPVGGRSVGAMQPSATPTAELVTHPDTKEPALWVHDDSVEPGKTYKYRMRAKLWNRYAGQLKQVVNPEEAKKTVIEGEWSVESEEITVKPRSVFFVNSSRLNESNRVNVDVWAWREGKWLKERFDVGVGDVIGGKKDVTTDDVDDKGKKKRVTVDFTTGAVVLDLRFGDVQQRVPNKSGYKIETRQSVVLSYLDPADGQVKERVQIVERLDPLKKQLEAGGEG